MVAVLIADDNQLILQTLERVLWESSVGRPTRDAVHIQTVLSALEVKIEMRRRQYDAVILDIRFEGDKSGIDVARWVRATQPSCAIMMMSAFPISEGVRREIRDLGASFCEKPIDTNDLLNFIRAVAQDVQ